MRGPIFSAVIDNIAVTAIQDIFELVTSANSRIAICGMDIVQNTDFGDAAAEGLFLRLIRGHSTTGSGGAAVTPSNHEPWSRAAVTTCARNNTTPATGGSPQTMVATGFNVQAGYFYRPRWSDGGFDERIMVAESSRFVVNMPAAPIDSISINATIWWQELGLLAP
jgi:hypothetical protein